VAFCVMIVWCPVVLSPHVIQGVSCQNGDMTRVIHVPYTVEQDEDGVWCASAQIRPGVGAVGDGPTREAAVAELRDALEALITEVGVPDELTLTLDVA
jgi:predicted RNase H-like HicB family nuclease